MSLLATRADIARPVASRPAPALPSPAAFDDFHAAGEAVLAFLHARFGFGLWMLTRVEGDDWIVLQAEDHGYGIAPGTVLRWADSFCSRMVRGEGPAIAPRADRIEVYRQAPVARQIPIGAYMGVPLTGTDGHLFGTLCAVDPRPQPEAIADEQPLLELLAGFLGTVLRQELRGLDQQRRLEQLELEALTDAVTRLFNRRGWDRLLAAEEERCRRYGHAATVVVVDLDRLKETNDRDGHHAGDALIARAADALQACARANDVVARLGGDEFALLAVECGAAGAEALRARIQGALRAADVDASVGLAVRDPALGLESAWRLADQRMYQAKPRR